MERVKSIVWLPFGLLIVFGGLGFFAYVAHAASGINQQINYQARLLDTTGATVPDGNYNMEFKVYQDGTGCVSGGSSPCGGTLEWTETRTGTNKVTVKNGYFSVQLGSVTAFGTSVNWNWDTLWLSVNIGGTGSSPSWDGEMTPFRQLDASPYALNSNQLGGLTAAQFLQLAPGSAQVDSGTTSSEFINKTGASGNIIELQNNGSDVAVFNNTGALTLQNASNSTAELQVKNQAGNNILTVDSSTGSGAIVLGNDGTPANLTVRGGAASGNNVAGGTLTVDASNGTGSGGSGDLIFRTAAPTVASTPVTFDSSATFQSFTSASSYNFSFSISGNSNRAIFVTLNAGASVSSMSYNGTAMTKINATTSPGISEMWYLLVPNATAAGSYTLTINFSGSSSGGVGLGVAAYSNVASIGTQNTATGTSATSSSVSVTATTSQLVVDGLVTCTNTPTVTGSGQTSRYNNSNWGSVSGSDKQGTGGTTTLSWSFGGTCNYEDFAVPVNPVSSGSTTADTLTDRLHVTASGNVGISNSAPTRTLDVAGNWGGNEDDNAQTNNASGTTTVTDSTQALVYNLTANKTSGNNSSTTIFNITGLPETNGTFAYVLTRASHNAGLGTSAQQCVNVEINSNPTLLTSNVCDTASNSAQHTNYHQFLVVRVNGSWSVIASASSSAFPVQAADLAEWIATTGPQPQAGEILSTGDNVSAHVSTSEYDPKVAGVVSTNPNTVYGQQTASSVALALSGRIPTIVTSLGGNLQSGDAIVSSPLAGIGMLPTRSGYAVAKALEAFAPSPSTCVPASSYAAIAWPADDGTNPQKPCFSVPVSSLSATEQQTLETEYKLKPTDVIYVGKVMALANLTWAQVSSDLDTVNPQALNIGSVNATSIDLNQDTTIAAGKSLVVNGPTTIKAATDSINAFQIQSADGTNVLTADTKHMAITVTHLTVAALLTINGHIVTDGSAPTIAANPAACMNPTVRISGNDIAGTITILTGTQCRESRGNQLATVTFHTAYSTAPQVLLTAMTPQAASLPVYDTTTATTYTISTPDVPTDETPYTYRYFVVQ